jgi:ketosteroid isomerase-like protein
MKKILSELFPSVFKKASQPNDVVAAGEQLLSRWVTAVNRCDVNAVMQLFAADVIFYGTSTKTLITSSNGIRQYFEQAFAQLQPLSMSLDNKKMLSISGEVMLLACSDKWSVKLDGQQQIMFGRLVLTAAIRQGQWKIVSFHRSVMPD